MDILKPINNPQRGSMKPVNTVVYLDGHSPRISDSGTWEVWDDSEKKYVDTGVNAGGIDTDLRAEVSELSSQIEAKTEEIDRSKLVDGYISSSGSMTAQTASKERTTDYIQVIPAITYKVTLQDMPKQAWVGICTYTKDKTFIARIINQTTTTELAKEISFDENVRYVRVSFRSFGDDSIVSFFRVYSQTMRDKLDSTTSTANLCANKLEAIRSSLDGFGSANYEYVNKSDSFHRITIHRGKSSVYPENTFFAFEGAVTDGYNSIETDVRFTSDNVPVLMHDTTIDRTSSGTGTVSNMTYAELLELDFGSWKDMEYSCTIPTLDEFVKWCKNKAVYPVLEVKISITDQQAGIIVGILKKYGMARRTTIISTYKATLTALSKFNEITHIGFIGSGVAENDIAFATSIKTQFNCVFMDIATRYLVEDYFNAVNSAGFPLEAWVYNTSPNSSTKSWLDGYTRNL